MLARRLQQVNDMSRQKLRHGDFWRICDRTGFRVPASQTVREWNGLIVRSGVSEARHPQDFVRAKRENMRVPDPRPPPVDAYIGTLRTEITTVALPGALTIEVLHTERFIAGDRIGLPLTSGDMYRAVVQEVTDTTHLLLTAPLPDGAPVGSIVTNYTAVSPPVTE